MATTSPTTSATALLAREATSAGRARRFLDATLRDWSCLEAADVAMLLASELVTNALLHAGSGVHLEIHRAAAGVRVEVHDTSRDEPIVRHVSSAAESGRGLALVDALASDWGVAPCRHGKRVWFEVAVEEPATSA